MKILPTYHFIFRTTLFGRIPPRKIRRIKITLKLPFAADILLSTEIKGNYKNYFGNSWFGGKEIKTRKALRTKEEQDQGCTCNSQFLLHRGTKIFFHSSSEFVIKRKRPWNKIWKGREFNNDIKSNRSLLLFSICFCTVLFHLLCFFKFTKARPHRTLNLMNCFSLRLFFHRIQAGWIREKLIGQRDLPKLEIQSS